ncbi:hypothetical protein GWK08_14220 [Leptobacterium flavescens]|uniref:Cardiolipin synthase N-terminal domain-containing protein n=1 Tax=Leptobacterium flavescens TaxID=472055 RepID=A0A6P0UNR2_9FLAO|nr:hypothetical protein [Leptobacterium flavescens]NER14607.1 hypothetical protein [Leptobacterium flavescens]
MIAVIDVFITVLAAYFGIGVLFGIYFFLAGARRIDPLIEDSKWTVRLLLLPGAIATWIFLLPKLFKNKKQ